MEQSPFGIILRAHDKDATKAFYEQLGLAFSEHRHDNGPLHYASDIRGAVLEIYQGRQPGEPRQERDYRESGETTLYLELPPGQSIDEAAAGLRIVKIIRERALVLLQDPDGRVVMVATRNETGS